MVQIRFCQLPHGADLDPPAYATAGSAGLDLRAAIREDLILDPGKRALVPTGIAIELPDGYEGQIRPRSGLAAKFGVTVLNSPGTIDADYRGEILVLLINHGELPCVLQRGQAVAQLVVQPFAQVDLIPAERLADTDRGTGGFGSTDRRR